MTPTAVVELTWVREALPDASPRLGRLLDHAIETADFAASDLYSLGDFVAAVPADHAENLGVLLVPLFLALAEGSLAIDLRPEALERRLCELMPAEDCRSWIDAALADLDAGRFANVLTVVRDDRVPADVPLVAWDRGARRHLYFQKYLKAERQFDQRLRERLASPGPAADLPALRTALEEVLTGAPLRAGGRPIAWDPDQLTALGVALLRKLAIISGGPGTGKTSIVLNVLRCLVRAGLAPERIALAAPTGRAAQRLSDSLRAGLATLGTELPESDRGLSALTPVTLHTLLEYQPHRNIYRRHEENPIPADLVLVDEVSMVSADQMASLLRALEPGARLLLLGDRDQLPSVEAGAVLGQLVGDLTEPSYGAATCAALRELLPGLNGLSPGPDHWLRDTVVFLRTNHRSHPQIREAAQAVNQQDGTLLDRLPRMPGPAEPNVWDLPGRAGGCWWWEQKQASITELRQMLHRWAENTYLAPLAEGGTFLELLGRRPNGPLDEPAAAPWLSRLFTALDRARLLTLLREGPWGCEQVNHYLQEWLRRRTDRARHDAFFPGLPVLITRNDRVRQLSNGDVGLTVLSETGDPSVVFARQGSYTAFAPENLPTHEPGFALTVHKSQGSEYQQVMLLLPPAGGRRLLTKELLYTAVTRAKQLAVLCGTSDAFREAIRRRIVRESGLTGLQHRGFA